MNRVPLPLAEVYNLVSSTLTQSQGGYLWAFIILADHELESPSIG